MSNTIINKLLNKLKLIGEDYEYEDEAEDDDDHKRMPSGALNNFYGDQDDDYDYSDDKEKLSPNNIALEPDVNDPLSEVYIPESTLDELSDRSKTLRKLQNGFTSIYLDLDYLVNQFPEPFFVHADNSRVPDSLNPKYLEHHTKDPTHFETSKLSEFVAAHNKFRDNSSNYIRDTQERVYLRKNLKNELNTL
jgi:hypothetical protein